MKYILSIDIGTSNVRAILMDSKGKMVSISQKELETLHPFKGHTEMNPEKIIFQTLDAIEEVLRKTNISKDKIAGIGIANARETTIVWDKVTGKPVWNAILWNDTRSKEFCEEYKSSEEMIKKKTGLPLTSYGSATKVRWILKNANIENKENCLFGTLNTWLLWKLTGSKVFSTDVTNASRTLLFNIDTMGWDDELLAFFDIPKSMLPKLASCCETYGHTDLSFFGAKIPICSMIGDAQSALFSAGCHGIGDEHISLGTGGFLLKNSGPQRPKDVAPFILTTVAWQFKDAKPVYCTEGSVFSVGSVVEWLKTHVGIIRSAKEIEGLAYSVPDSFGVYFVPAIHGISSIKGGERVRGTLLGLSSSTNIGHICRSALEGIAYMLSELYQTMNPKNNSPAKKIKCSGGVSENIFLMQMSANLMGVDLLRSKNIELSSFGAAYLAGISLGIWKDQEEVKKLFSVEREFSAAMTPKDKAKIIRDWKKAFAAALLFSDI
ncbi:MAG: Glycerol kinase [Chlamydiia bacterium]|nr:Glycerol kinase [Chlamydiia bacterium]MCH9618340.1 Glycerol kinase [Chlamydiia bacterium]